MVKFSSVWSLGLVLIAGFVSAQTSPSTANIEVTAEFPDNPFGLIVNGQKNKIVLDIANKEKSSYSVYLVTGKVTKAGDDTKVTRDLAAIRYEKPLAAGGSVQIPYSFYSEYAPGEHGLTLYVDLLANDIITRVTAYSGTITVTEPEGSWFDIQLLVLYAVLAAGAAGVAYVVREAFFVDAKKAKKAKKVEEPTERPTHRDEQGNLVLDNSWIQDHHLNLNSPKKTSPKIKKRSAKK